MPAETNNGGQSPPPEAQSGKQLHDAPAGGQGVDDTPNKKESMTDQLKNLSDNPKGPMDSSLEAKFSKESAQRDDTKAPS